MKKKIFVTIPEMTKESMDMLDMYFDITKADHRLSVEELAGEMIDTQGLLCSTNDTIDASVFEAGKELKAVSSIGVGTDHIDLAAAQSRNIPVRNTSGVVSASVAEHVFAQLLCLSRNIIPADAYVREGKFKESAYHIFLGTDLKNKTIGLVGFGNVAQAIVPIAKGFGMYILYTNKSGPLDIYEKDTQVNHRDLVALLKESDVVVLALPLTKESAHLISYERLCLMKKNAVLINMARGPVVKEVDLVRALHEKKIAGACLDVFEFEPKVHEELLSMSQTVLTPHIGSATKEAKSALYLKAAENLVQMLEIELQK
jgi:glyoxylate reductase